MFLGAPKGDTPRVRRRPARRRPRAVWRASEDVHRPALARRVGRRARAALDRLPPEVRDEPPVLRLLHGEEHRRRDDRRRPRERRPGHVPQGAAADPAPPGREPQRRAAPVRPGRTALDRHRRRRGRRRPVRARPGPALAARQDDPDERRRRAADAAPVGHRPAQPVAVLVRPLEPHALDRRRRPERVGGDRPRHEAGPAVASQLRLEPVRGPQRVQLEPEADGRHARAAADRAAASGVDRDRRRLRLPRL